MLRRTILQGVVLSAAILGFWAWSFRRGGRPSPLEMAGGVIVLGASLLVIEVVRWVGR